MFWFSLTLLSAFSLATADALSKKYLGPYTTTELIAVRFVYAGLLLAPLLGLHALPPLPLAFWGWVGVSIPLEIMAMLLYMEAIRDGQLSLTLPHLALTPVFTIALGYLLLGEKVSLKGMAGIGLVALGTFLLHTESTGSLRVKLVAPFRAIRYDRAVGLMLAVAVIYSLTVVTTKAALRYLPGSQFGPFYFVLLGAATLVFVALFQPAAANVLFRRPLLHLLIGGLFATMVITHFIAIERVQAAYMIAVKRSSILLAVIYGAVLFGEPRFGRRLAAASLMLAGVAVIAIEGRKG